RDCKTTTEEVSLMNMAFESWRGVFLETVQEPNTAAPLKEASLASDLKAWTGCLTASVVRSCETLGLRAAGRGHPLNLLPQVGQEYLGIDVMAFPAVASTVWPSPLAVFELENHAKDDRVAYSLWKVLCLRVRLRVVFAYRPDWERSRQLVGALT